MSDPSGEPKPPAQPGGPQPMTAAGEPSHLAPAPRVHLSAVHAPRDTAKPPAPPPGFRAVLEWLRLHGNLDLDADEAGPMDPSGDARSGPSRLSREQRKFHRFDPEHPHPASTAADEASPGRAVGSSTNAPPGSPGDDHPRGITAEQLAYMRQLRAGTSERRLWIALGVAVIAFLLATAVFLASHAGNAFAPAREPIASVPVPPHPSDTVTVLPAESMDLLDRAMAAETASDYPTAIDLLERARHGAGHIQGLNYRLAVLCYKANEMARVLPLLDQSIAAGEEVAACYSLRGILSNQLEGTAQEPGDLEKATRLEPFNARFFFVWGEALRRAGKPQLALPQLQRALARLEEPALAPLYALKLRLTQVELGQSDALAGEMAEKLKEVPAPVEWLLTGAAAQMHGGDFAAAAVTLERARGLVGARETAQQLNDVFFKTFAREPELARFFDGAVSP